MLTEVGHHEKTHLSLLNPGCLHALARVRVSMNVSQCGGLHV